MAAQVSTPTPRTIRVYCPSHKVGFSAAATATIECSSSTHTLAHNFPSESFWKYCCDCQHYWPIDAAKGNKSSDECLVCERHIDRRALCSECKVMSVESNDAAKRKAFLISSAGSVTPACPGCLRQTRRTVFKHSCPDFGAIFVTTREVCPFCDEQLVPPAIKLDPPPVIEPVQPDTTTCASCGQSNLAQYSFCMGCGTQLKSLSNQYAVSEFDPQGPSLSRPVERTDPEFEFPSYESAVPAEPTGLQPKTILGVVGGIALLGILLSIIAFVSTTGPNIEKKLDTAIAAGQIFTPATQNAHDLFYQLKNSGASEEKLRPYRDKLLPLLTETKFQLIKTFMVAGNDDPPVEDWQAAYQSLQFATELKPGDGPIRARALYCEGRLAYLAKDEDRAIQVWTRAADADKSWPLPVNGIGLIYTARKNYPAARNYYFEAIRRDPNWAYPYNNIGTSFFMEKNYSDAKDYYQKAVQLAPQWGRPHSWLGDIAIKEIDYNAAVQEFSQVLAPNATGTKNMDLDKIRQKLEFARQRAGF